MGSYTTRLNLYLPGGGSSGLIIPDEAVDIDKLNDNFKKIDIATGVLFVTSTTRPASPADGQQIYETDTKKHQAWKQALNNWVDLNENYAPLIPSGTIWAFAGSALPSGWAWADGGISNRTTEARLFAAIGTTYGVGDGTTTFNRPDLRERTPAGYKSGSAEFGTIGQVGGEKSHILTTTEMPSHTHNIATKSSAGGFGTEAPARALYGSDSTWATSAAGGGGAHNNLQPYITLNYIVKL